MAESQTPFSYPPETVQQLMSSLSLKRYNAYLRGAGFKPDLAFQLYLYNARLAKSFLFPLHVVEVVLRNAIDEVLSKEFSIDWPVDPAFIGVLTVESAASLNKAVVRAPTGPNGASKDDVIANLTFDFWSNLFRQEYDRSLWQTTMQVLLPNAPFQTRHGVRPIVANINHLRNRIAHHEPIWREDVSKRISEINDVVGWRCATTGQWLRSHTTVFQAMRTKPAMDGSGTSGPTLKDRCDNNFDTIDRETLLSECPVNDACAIICVDGARTCGVIDASDFGRYIRAHTDETGLCDLNEHRVNDVVAWTDGGKSFVELGAGVGLSQLKQEMKGKATRFVLVVDPPTGQVIGVIRKAHRKY